MKILVWIWKCWSLVVEILVPGFVKSGPEMLPEESGTQKCVLCMESMLGHFQTPTLSWFRPLFHIFYISFQDGDMKNSFLGSALPLYTAMFVSQSDVRIITKSTQTNLCRAILNKIIFYIFKFPIKKRELISIPD